MSGIFKTPEETLDWVTEQSKKVISEKRALVMAISKGELVIISGDEEDVDKVSAILTLDLKARDDGDILKFEGKRYNLWEVDDEDD